MSLACQCSGSCWRAAECIGADGDFQILYVHANTRYARIALSAHLPDTCPHKKAFFFLDGEVPFSPKVSHGLSSVGTSHPMRFLASAKGSSCSNSRELCEKGTRQGNWRVYALQRVRIDPQSYKGRRPARGHLAHNTVKHGGFKQWKSLPFDP